MATGTNELPSLHPVPGIRLATVSAGIKKPGRKDVVLIEAAEGTTCAAVFTRNAFCAAPVTVAREHWQASGKKARYLLVNTGNANAGTGAQGLQSARTSCEQVAELAGVDPETVLPFSTGVIGEQLPVEKITAVIPEALAGLTDEGWADAASGIMTTDTRPKGCSVRFTADGREYTLTGISKGAGMIRPNMATMLGYVATDMAVEAEVLQQALADAVAISFNRVTVDGDTSTNDACVLLATGAAGNDPVSDLGSSEGIALRDALQEVCVTLAQALVRDGEGASKFVTVQVDGGRDEQECLDVAFTIAHSPLVKTALFASDPNWGRLLAAIGRAGLQDLDVDKVGVFLNDVLIAENGCRAASYTEEQGVAAMAPEDIVIRVELNRGNSGASVWTTDFSYDYVKINAEYRT
ncbi:bifunctional glutamate N-acetyltransferase/amino-acid acetyltransferase ArgJ [Parahaliea maris]|uniref:Arginine biosynthesis bifunctional protein ArgJ n=1 Tax=Parahaliea maris TaxID=2716870 RepID=A0A5C9AAI9_9GAMM|nr:bifunctional glutamate N-acetyltransferase/amino-acid acetyltransferase ArgJ [Parahaliea maris]TXS96321.1 bifunctional glutamate N-acetyltransferase/amino-acid acetyltransferase ArgJ [Parahaliea maris]